MPMFSRALSTIALGGALIGSAAGADTTINDLRFGVGHSITDESEISAGGNAFDYDADTLRFALQYMRSLNPLESAGGFIFGGELFYSQSSGELPIFNIDVNTIGLEAFAGWAFALDGMPLHFEGTPFIGLGQANTEFSNGGDSEDHDNMLIEYGLRVAGYYTFENNWQAGLEVRYVIDSSTDAKLGSNDFDVETAGLLIGLQGGYRF